VLGVGVWRGWLSLTPTLSLREREKRKGGFETRPYGGDGRGKGGEMN
jgi:hypothetical protein